MVLRCGVTHINSPESGTAFLIAPNTQVLSFRSVSPRRTFHQAKVVRKQIGPGRQWGEGLGRGAVVMTGFGFPAASLLPWDGPRSTALGRASKWFTWSSIFSADSWSSSSHLASIRRETVVLRGETHSSFV
ncbi:MAG: hypothetical protein ACE5HK_05280 [Candidatus Methylomirabilales bacterium]